MKKKAYALFVILMLFLCAACLSIINVSSGADYVDAAGKQSVYKLDVAKARGTIYDCALTPLVGTKKERIAAVAPTIEAVGALEKATDGQYRDRLAAALEDGKPFVLPLTENVEHECVDLFQIPQRYSGDQLAPHIIGYLDSLDSGVTGVELAMNDVLDEHTGEVSIYYQVDALGRVIAGGDRRVVNTLETSQGGVALTLDAKLQRLVQDAARELDRGAVVVTEVPNCEIRALASVPDFSPLDLGEAAKAEDSPLVNRAFSAYAPGSVFKLTSAAVELEQDNALEEFSCTGSVNAGGLLFHCIGGKPHGQVNLETAIEKSCNCYFINAARSLGGQSVLSMAYNLGFGVEQEFGRGLLTDAGNLPEASSLGNVRALANFAFGQGEVTVTPVQLCGMMNAIASGGEYSSPKLIAGRVTSRKDLIPYEPVTDRTLRVMEESTARKLQGYLEGAAESGTAAVGAPQNCLSGIKTGTAQTGVYQDGEELLHFWYCGFIGDENGLKYCVTVLRESTPDDGGAAARVFQNVTEGIAELFLSSGGGEEE